MSWASREVPVVHTGGTMLRWTARLRFRAALQAYLESGSAEDRARMLERAAVLRLSDQASCSVNVDLVALDGGGRPA